MIARKYLSVTWFKCSTGVAILVTALLMKLYYRSATVEELGWILFPVASAVTHFSDVAFVFESSTGWVNREQLVVIAPSCSGLNFMIIAFCMSSFQVLMQCHRNWHIVAGVIVSAGVSYLVTIVANVARIILSMSLYQTDIYAPWLLPETVHRIAGIGVYYSILFFYYQQVSFMLQRVRDADVQGKRSRFEPVSSGVIPLGWYLLFVFIIPQLNPWNSFDGSKIVFHTTTVTTVSIMLGTLLWAILCGARSLLKKQPLKTTDSRC